MPLGVIKPEPKPIFPVVVWPTPDLTLWDEDDFNTDE